VDLAQWARQPTAAPSDRHLADLVNLRVELSRLYEHLRSTAVHSEEDAVALIQQALDNWNPGISALEVANNPVVFRQAQCVSLIHAQTKLLAASFAYRRFRAIRDSVSPTLRDAFWRAAKEACELLALHADALRHLPASISLMIVYGALLLVTLPVPAGEDVSAMALIGLAAQVAQFLCQSGAEPRHRCGPNAIYGHHLLRVLRKSFPNKSYESNDAALAVQRGVLPETFSEIADLQTFLDTLNSAPFYASDAFWETAPQATVPFDAAATSASTAAWPSFDWLIEDPSASRGNPM